MCPHVKGTAPNPTGVKTVLPTEHVPGTLWGNSHRDQYRGPQTRGVSGFNAMLQELQFEVDSNEPGYTCENTENGQRFGDWDWDREGHRGVWEQVCRAVSAGGPGHSDVTYRALFLSSGNGI